VLLRRLKLLRLLSLLLSTIRGRMAARGCGCDGCALRSMD